MGQVLGAALLFGAVGLIAKSLVQTGGPAGDPDWELHETRQGRRDRHRAPRRLHRRADVSRQRRVLRPHAARRLPASCAQGRRDRHLPRGDPALRRRRRALGGREHRLRDPVLAPAGLDPGRAHRRSADACRSPSSDSGCSSPASSASPGSSCLNVPFAGTIVVVVLSAGGVALLVWLARHSWIRFVRGRGATAAASAAE